MQNRKIKVHRQLLLWGFWGFFLQINIDKSFMPQGARVTYFLICRLNSRAMCHPLCTFHLHASYRSSAGTASFCLNSRLVKERDYTSPITYNTLFPDSSREHYCKNEGNKPKVTQFKGNHKKHVFLETLTLILN